MHAFVLRVYMPREEVGLGEGVERDRQRKRERVSCLHVCGILCFFEFSFHKCCNVCVIFCN